jgi:hypothetical protein
VANGIVSASSNNFALRRVRYFSGSSDIVLMISMIVFSISCVDMLLRAAIQNAASVAGLLITTEAMIAELPKKNAGGGGMPPGGAAWAAWISELSCSEVVQIRRPRSDAGPFAYYTQVACYIGS